MGDYPAPRPRGDYQTPAPARRAGGRLDEAMRGYHALVEAGIDTVASDACASACALLFLRGKSRSVDARGAIGVHQWKSVEGEASEAEAQLASADLVQLTVGAGVSEEFYVAGAGSCS